MTNESRVDWRIQTPKTNTNGDVAYNYFLPTQRLPATLSQTITWQPTSSVHCSHLLSRDIPERETDRPTDATTDSIGMAATKTERMMLWWHGWPPSQPESSGARQGERDHNRGLRREMIAGVLQQALEMETISHVLQAILCIMQVIFSVCNCTISS